MHEKQGTHPVLAGRIRSFGANPVITWFRAHLGPLVGLLILCIIVSLISDKFLTRDNFLNILKSISTNAILSCALTMVIVMGLIDISVGSITGLSGIVCATLISLYGFPVWLSVSVCLVIGVTLGLFNGFFIANIKVPAFIATLATQNIARGMCQVICNGSPVRVSVGQFTVIGTATFMGGVSIVVLYAVVCVAITCVLMYKTRLGPSLFAIGGNQVAADYSGINIKRMIKLPYIIGGLLAAVCGIVWTARLGSGTPTLGTNFELDAIAATALGGTSMSGGRGSIGGTMIGVFIIGIITNGLNLINVNSFYQLVVKGMVILIAVVIDIFQKNRLEKAV